VTHWQTDGQTADDDDDDDDDDDRDLYISYSCLALSQSTSASIMFIARSIIVFCCSSVNGDVSYKPVPLGSRTIPPSSLFPFVEAIGVARRSDGATSANTKHVWSNISPNLLYVMNC